MPKYNLYGLGNALVDTEYQVSEDLLLALGVEKGMMTLIDSEQLAVLEEKLRDHATLKKTSIRWVCSQFIDCGCELWIQGLLQLQSRK